MIAKLIVRDSDRPAALERMRKALGEFEVAGPVTNLGFSTGSCKTRFRRRRFDTGLIERHRSEFSPFGSGSEEGAGTLQP